MDIYRPSNYPNSIRITILIPNRIQLQHYSPNPTRTTPTACNFNPTLAQLVHSHAALNVCMHAYMLPIHFMVKNNPDNLPLLSHEGEILTIKSVMKKVAKSSLGTASFMLAL